MRRHFKIALLAIPTLTLLTHVGVGAWETRHISTLRDSIDVVVFQTLRLQSEIGYGGLIHNFKNAVLRDDEPEYIELSQKNVEQAIAIVDRLESMADDLDLGISLPATRQMIRDYGSKIPEIMERDAEGLSVTELDAMVRIDDTPALEEIQSFQKQIIEQINASINSTQMALLLAGVLISMIALAGGYYIFMMSQAEQRRIDERRRAADQRLMDQVNLHNADLVRVNTSLQQFAGIAAHDLSTPSRQIISFTELACEAEANEEQRDFYLQAIRQSAQKMRKLVETLLEFARQGFRNPQRQQVNMASLCREVANELGRNLERPFDIRIGELPYAQVDPGLMERVLTNLVENAIRYAKPGELPVVKIDGWRQQGRSFFAVEDNGIGVQPKYADLVFEPFKRIKADVSDGTGIGLSLVKSIIEAHGGRIRLDTDYTDGARFVFWLPEREEYSEVEAA